MTGRFQPRATEDIARLIAEYPLAWVISAGAAGQAATPLPLLAETGDDGTVRSLLGHFARANPHAALIERQPEAMILFQGPQGYISPRLVSRPDWAPTWNYAVLRFDVEIALSPAENHAALAALAEALERDQPRPWSPGRLGPRYARLEPRIIAFHATVRATHAGFKLGQDETADTFAEIVGGLGDGDLARWMKKTRAV